MRKVRNVRKLRDIFADVAVIKYCGITEKLVDEFGYDNAIKLLQWQIDCIHAMKEEANDEFIFGN